MFKLNTDGTGFATLYSFTAGSDGASPNGLISSSNTLYGTAGSGGSGGNGTVFKLNTDGTGFTTLYSFIGGSDGAIPNGGLNLTNNTLYGATYGGSSGNGTAFAVNTDGTGFTNLLYLGRDAGGLILSGNTLYGTESGSYGWGVDCSYFYGSVFRVNTDGTGFTNLYNGDAGSVCNDEGKVDFSRLILSGTTLYVAVSLNAPVGPHYYISGEVFAVNTDGTGGTNLHSFPGSISSRTGPVGLISSGNTLYGTTSWGGSSDVGMVFSLTLPPPQLAIIPSAANVILSWPTNFTGFTLQSTTNLVSPVWITNSPTPVIVNGQLAVTNPISGTQQFFRLSQ